MLGKSGDGGIDGIIKEDKLGLDIIYIQAKRWENVVGRPEIQKFAGALLGQKAKKGIFITTSGYSQEAIEYADNLENKPKRCIKCVVCQAMRQHQALQGNPRMSSLFSRCHSSSIAVYPQAV